MKTIKELEQYLNDLDNLIDTGHFPKDSLKDFTFHHKDLTLRDFVQKGRNFIAEKLTEIKQQKLNNEFNQEQRGWTPK